MALQFHAYYFINSINEHMKKNILKILIGALLIGVIVLFLGWQYYLLKKNEYKQQLEQVIDSK